MRASELGYFTGLDLNIYLHCLFKYKVFVNHFLLSNYLQKRTIKIIIVTKIVTKIFKDRTVAEELMYSIFTLTTDTLKGQCHEILLHHICGSNFNFRGEIKKKSRNYFSHFIRVTLSFYD